MVPAEGGPVDLSKGEAAALVGVLDVHKVVVEVVIGSVAARGFLHCGGGREEGVGHGGQRLADDFSVEERMREKDGRRSGRSEARSTHASTRCKSERRGDAGQKKKKRKRNRNRGKRWREDERPSSYTQTKIPTQVLPVTCSPKRVQASREYGRSPKERKQEVQTRCRQL